MRFLCLSVLSLLCLSLSSVDAACAPAITGPPVEGQTPDDNALTMFVTSTTPSGALTGAGGLTAADNICTTRAAISTIAKATFNRGPAGQTVQFRAILSTSTVDAYSRIPAGIAIKSFENPSGNTNAALTTSECLAINRDELFIGFDGKGMDLNDDVNNEFGLAVGAETQVWTGTGLPTAATPTGVASEATANSYGGRYFTKGTPPADFDAVKITNYCNDWTQSTGASTSTGILGSVVVGPNGPGQSTWLQAKENVFSCNNGFRLLCISAQAFSPPTTPSVAGDPQFTGLQGQSFQVHGMPEEYFNLITTPTFQLNSRFTYLASGNCNYNNTECWTHPGTYVDQLGFMFPGLQVKAVAGPHHKGLRVWINDEEMHKSTGRLVMTTTTGMNATSTAEVTVSHPHHDVLSVSFPLFTFTITNSDWFFNFNIEFHAPEVLQAGQDMHFIQDTRSAASTKQITKVHYLPEGMNQVYPAYPMHGLVGQTWKNARYAGKRMYQGDVDDYMMLDHQLFSTQFMYNLYAY